MAGEARDQMGRFSLADASLLNLRLQIAHDIVGIPKQANLNCSND
jgi:hypothetical protein